jgi:hypothetical protein
LQYSAIINLWVGVNDATSFNKKYSPPLNLEALHNEMFSKMTLFPIQPHSTGHGPENPVTVAMPYNIVFVLKLSTREFSCSHTVLRINVGHAMTSTCYVERPEKPTRKVVRAVLSVRVLVCPCDPVILSSFFWVLDIK